MDPHRNRPTLATLLTAFVTALLSWALTAVPESWPNEVTASGYALALAVVAVVIGRAAQVVGRHAPWAADTHTAAVAYALSLDPAEHPIYSADADEQMHAVGIDDMADARTRLGLDP